MPSAQSRLFPNLGRSRDTRQRMDEAPKVTFTATKKQAKLMEVITSGLYTFIGFGGGIRSTKTFGTLGAIITLCRAFPRSRWAVVRADLPTIKRNVIPSFNKIRALTNGFVGEVNRSDWTAKCANGSEIIFFPELFSQDPELERWKGLEVNGFDLEEASELNEKSANKAIERAGSWVIPPTDEDPEPRQPPPYVFATFNPCKNWPRKWFYEPWKNGTIKAPYYFLPSTIADNPYASEEYKESLTYLPKEEYNRFVKGEWDFVDDPDQLIKSEWIWAARSVEPDRRAGPHKLGVDVARYGDDFTVLALIDGNALVALEEHKGLSIDRTADFTMEKMTNRSAPIDPQNVIIDSIGLGAGVVDICRRRGHAVTEFNSSGRQVERDFPKPKQRKDKLQDWVTIDQSVFKFKNLRAQAWWEFREKIRLKLFSLSLRGPSGQELPLPEKLVADLAAPRYFISGDKVIEVESKDDIKLRLGRSTDDGDAVVMGAFDMPPQRSETLKNDGSWRVVRK